nr:hypothetical transcript [Hymenolepis microstoma]
MPQPPQPPKPTPTLPHLFSFLSTPTSSGSISSHSPPSIFAFIQSPNFLYSPFSISLSPFSSPPASSSSPSSITPSSLPQHSPTATHYRNKTGNRRTANVRSVGYSDLFCLSKDDLWETLTEYPEAKEKLMEAGQQMLRKDNLLDEELLRKAEESRETVEEKPTRFDANLEQISTKLARLLGEFDSSQAKLKRRPTRLENQQFESAPPSVRTHRTSQSNL